MNSAQVPGTAELGGPAPEDIQKQLNKIVHSKIFRHSSALQRLLQYLINRSIEDPFGDIKEYTIGTEVFDRGPDYDPQTDTIVRVQVHRLRLKVKEYYESEGANDPIVVDVPKGRYIPTFEFRPSAAKEAAADAVAHVAAPQEAVPAIPLSVVGQEEKTDGGQFWRRAYVLAALACVLFAAGILIGWRLEESRVAAAANAKGENAAQAFWHSFMGSDAAPVVGYADAVYLVDGAEDLFRFRRGASDNTGTEVEPHLAQQFASSPGLVAKAGPLYYEDGNTGTGDLQSVFVLTRLFTQMGMNMTVKRCRLITIDDLQQHDVILLGSPEENDAVAQLSQPSEFVWKRQDVPGPWKGEYINVHPRAGEGATFKTERDANTQEITADYGLITVQPGAAPNRYIAILGGLDTSGVAGTAQFMTSPSEMAELRTQLAALGALKGDGPPLSFQALLRVDVERGNDVLDVHLITVHLVSDKGTAATPSNSAAQ